MSDVKGKPAVDATPVALKTTQLIEQLDRAVHEANKVGGEFCLTDLDAAMTMLDRAETTRDDATRQRNLLNAREAFEVVSRLAGRLTLEAEVEQTIRERLRTLSERLRRVAAGR